jgi:hypothetical protein
MTTCPPGFKRESEKNKISYPENTVLIIDCHGERLVLEPGWEYLVNKRGPPRFFIGSGSCFLLKPDINTRRH